VASQAYRFRVALRFPHDEIYLALYAMLFARPVATVCIVLALLTLSDRLARFHTYFATWTRVSFNVEMLLGRLSRCVGNACQPLRGDNARCWRRLV
jgi:hypothetical protein